MPASARSRSCRGHPLGRADALDLLDHLVDWTRDAPLLLLCLSRPELLDERPGWGGQEHAEAIRLEPLSHTESDELIDELTDDPGLRDELRARIRDTAEGNPLFVEQLLAAVTESGDARDLPPTIHALLAARLDGLPAEERDVLERASVVGQEFEWEALAVLAADKQPATRGASFDPRAQGADRPARGDRGHVPFPPRPDPRRRLRANPEGAPL